MLGSYDVLRPRRLAALAAVASVALTGCSSTQTAPHPRPVATAIPSTFPLAAGTSNPAATFTLQRGAGIDPGMSSWVETYLTECGRLLRLVDSDTPVANVIVIGTRERPSDDRTLAVFPSVAVAKARLSAIARLVTSCPMPPATPSSPPAGLGGNAGRFLESHGGDASYAWTTPDSTVLHVAVRVGRAIVIERTTQTTATPEQSIAAAELRLQPVIAAMCVYADHPCPAPAPTPAPAS